MNVRGVIRLSLACLICFLGLTAGSQGVHHTDRQSNSVRETAPRQESRTEESPRASDGETTLGSTTTTVKSTTAIRTTPAFKPFRLENTSRAHRKAMRQARKGKSRRKRRGCKCVGRYMQDVEKMIDSKIKQFKDMYLIPKLKNFNSQRMNDNLLRLSGTVDETKKSLMKLSDSIADLLNDFQSRERSFELTNRELRRVSLAVANLTQHVEGMERRISSSGVKASRLRTRHPHGTAANQRTEMETSTPAKPLPTRE